MVVRRVNSSRRSKFLFKLQMTDSQSQMSKPNISRRMVRHTSTIVNWKRVLWRLQVSKTISKIGVSTSLCLITMWPMYRHTPRANPEPTNQQATRKRDKINILEVSDKDCQTSKFMIRVCFLLRTLRWPPTIPKLWTLSLMASLQVLGALLITIDKLAPETVQDFRQIIELRSWRQRTTWSTKTTWSQSLITLPSTWCQASTNHQTSPEGDLVCKRT